MDWARTLLVVVSLVVAWLVQPQADGWAVAEALAGPGVQLHVDVLRGTKGGEGADEAAARHQAILDRIAGYGGWTQNDRLVLEVEVGKTEKARTGPRSVSVSLEAITAEKAKTTIVVVDPNGKPHKLSSSMGRGGTAVLTVQSADGSEVFLFVVTVRW